MRLNYFGNKYTMNLINHTDLGFLMFAKDYLRPDNLIRFTRHKLKKYFANTF